MDMFETLGVDMINSKSSYIEQTDEDIDNTQPKIMVRGQIVSTPYTVL